MSKFNVHEWNHKRRLATLNENLNEEKYIVSITKNGSPTETNVHPTKERADAQAEKINGGFMDYEGAKFKAVVRLAEITAAEEMVAVDAVNTLQDAINKLKSSGLVNNAEAIALEALNTRMIKKVAQLRGDM